MPKAIASASASASDGIGAAAARKLHQDGHRVVVSRSPQKTEAVAAEIGAPHHLVDFAKLADGRALAAELNEAYRRIDVLANNAGGVFGDRAKTVDGFEKTFQINHLGPFLLTQLLLGTLIASRASVIQTSSVGARMGGNVVLDDLVTTRISSRRGSTARPSSRTSCSRRSCTACGVRKLELAQTRRPIGRRVLGDHGEILSTSVPAVMVR